MLDSVYAAERERRENDLLDVEVYRDDLRRERQRYIERIIAIDVDLVEADHRVTRKRAAVAQLDYIDSIRETHGAAVTAEVAAHVIGGKR